MSAWINVMDYGAVGDSDHDDTAAIQAAMDACPRYGRVVFPTPPYRYKITDTLRPGKPLHLAGARGAGAGVTQTGSTLFGQFDGFLVDYGDAGGSMPGPVVEGLTFYNTVGGGLRMHGYVLVSVRECVFLLNGAGVGLYLPNSDMSVLIQNCAFTGSDWLGKGIVADSHTSIQCCEFAGFHTGVQIGGPGISITGCRVERNLTGFLLGVDKDLGARPFIGTVLGNSFEANNIGIEARMVANSLFSGLGITGGPGAPDGVGATGLLVSVLASNTVFEGFQCSLGLTISPDCIMTRVAFRNVSAQTWTIPSGQTGVTFTQCDN